MRGLAATGTGSDDLVIPRRATADGAPLSFAQERLFLLDRIMPGVPLYNVPRLYKLSTSLDDAPLQEAFKAIVRRHDILRTSIELADGVPRQKVSDSAGFSLIVEDLRALPAGERRAAADRVLAEAAWRPFDLSCDVLVRAALVHVADDEDLLLVVPHHLASDHASTSILLSELDLLYDAAVSGREPELAELPIQYADYAAWQRERLAGSALEEQIDYWRNRLGDAPELLQLPTDRPRPRRQTYRGATFHFHYPVQSLQGLRELARANRASTYMALLAAFDVLIHRYSKQDDVVVGTAVSGRHYAETLPLVGFFSNTLALRTDLSGDPTFLELLGRVREAALMGQAHQEVPFEKVVEVINPQRDPGRTPLFQVLLTHNVERQGAARLGGVALEQLSVPGWEWSRFDLSFALFERNDGSVSGIVEYSTELFDAETIERMVGHYETLLTSVVRDAEQPISRLALLTADERKQLLGAWNDTDAPFPDRCLDELFSEQAHKTPTAVAVECEGVQVSYAQLDEQSSRLANRLRALGVGPGATVGICVERTVKLPVALLGALKTGAAYVPLDPSYPEDRQSFMLEDAGASVLVTEESLVGERGATDRRTLCLDRDWPDVEREDMAQPVVERSAEELAYVIYTSGSTGRPKGVEIAHRSVVNLMSEMRERPGLATGETLVNLTTPAFDLSVPDWYLPLLTGGRLVILPREATLEASKLVPRIEGAHVVQATPTTWQLLVDNGWQGNRRLAIVCGGEAVPRELANELAARSRALWHMYGPTETTVWSSITELGPGGDVVPLGGPIRNTRFYVLDEAAQPVPIGVPGELYIGGAGVARGYRNRPELTAEKFVADPFVDGARAYRTGDLVRWRADGTLEFLGRIDHQVKLRGYRIELGEIEAVLAAHPDVAAAVVVVREDTPGDRRLVAYVVGKGEAPPSVDDLRRLVRDKVPPYMVPSAFVMLDSLPLSANRKLDRSRLPAPDGARPQLERPYVEPASPVEERLAALWREILGVDRIGVDDDFFELGGHSLLAVRMLSRVQAEFDVDLPLTVVFENPSIRDLADVVSTSLVAETGDDDLDAVLAEIEAMTDAPA